MIEEGLILGELASGVQSIADLEANHAGLIFYRDLCDVDDPILALDGEQWTIARPVDLRDYVTPRWDESYQPSVYNKSRWRKVRPVLETYCDRLDEMERLAGGEERPPSSRRRSLRVPTDMAVTFDDAQGFARAYLRNISDGGVYIETTLPLKMDAPRFASTAAAPWMCPPAIPASSPAA